MIRIGHAVFVRERHLHVSSTGDNPETINTRQIKYWETVQLKLNGYAKNVSMRDPVLVGPARPRNAIAVF
ncbi:hypothetical protein UF64_14485 [Thalassospira sp. HJ]|nr:hypothetical protein UF64_14485 [Thalassospira sp. HJ]